MVEMHSLSSGEAKMPNKFKKVLALVAFTCLSLTVLDNSVTSVNDLNDRRRKLMCKNHGRNKSKNARTLAAEVEEVRELSNFEKFVDRLLVDPDNEDCDTSYPSNAADTVTFSADSVVAMQEPVFDVAPENPDDVDTSEVVNDEGVILLAPETTSDSILDETERGLITTYDPQTYVSEIEIARASVDDEGTIAYVTCATGCPEWYQPSGENIANEPILGSDLYEASAILKCQSCAMTDESAAARRLGKTRKLRQLADTGQLSAAEMNFTMHAIVHPMATECPLQGSNGETYNRVKLFQSQSYLVEIKGHPIRDSELQSTNRYIAEHIPEDVGIRDSAKLHIWTMILHPVVVLLDFETVLQKPIDQEIDELLADDNRKGIYILTAPDKNTGEAGVDTGFLIIKPSLDETDRIINAYLNTPFDPTTGWDGQGHHNFKGGMGISGFLSYYFANDPGYEQRDRCVYAHNADDSCLANTSLTEAKSLKIDGTVCGSPRDCPYDHPDWSPEKKEACSTLHHTYFKYRYDFEEKYFNKKHKTRRIGLFKQKSFLGYCRGPGKSGFLSMTGDVIEKPDWQVVCPSTGEECPEGTYLKNDCTCTTPEDPCAACPSNTFCQTSPTLMCIDCNCGFCDGGGSECCTGNGINSCGAGPGDNQSCNAASNYFSAIEGDGNICGKVELSKTAVPNGCGCKPSSYSPCTYNKDWGQKEDKCFVCTADDLAAGKCDVCKDCLATCANSDANCINSSFTTQEFMTCLSKITDPECRANCHFICMKN